MLTNALIEEFTRDYPSNKILVTKAWTELAVESKLQILNAHRKDDEGNSEAIPLWLHRLALDDDAEIVRIYATQCATITSFWTNENFSEAESYAQSESELITTREIQKKLKKDKSEIVRELINDSYGLSSLASMTQECRLISIRSIDFFRVEFFIAQLDEMRSKLSKEEFKECLDEVVALKNDASRMFAIDVVYDELNKLWELLPNLDDDVAYKLARILPIKSFNPSKEIKSEVFLRLHPKLTMFWVLKENQNYPTIELQKAAQVIIEDEKNEYDEFVHELAWKIIPEETYNLEEGVGVEKNRFFDKLRQLLK